GLTVAPYIPSNSNTWLKIVLVGLNSLLQAKVVVARSRKSGRCFELGRNLYVVTHAIIQRQIVPRPPRILPEKSHGEIGKGVTRTAETLDEVARNAQAVSLHGRERRDRPRELGGQRTVNRGRNNIGGCKATEVIDATVIHGEHCPERNVIKIRAQLRAVRTHRPRQIVAKLVASFGALDVRVWLATEVREAGNIHRRVGAARNRRVVEIRQSAPRILEAKIVDLVVTDCRGVLGNDGDITIGLLRSA